MLIIGIQEGRWQKWLKAGAKLRCFDHLAELVEAGSGFTQVVPSLQIYSHTSNTRSWDRRFPWYVK
jgi:hypothetical protein